MFSNYYFIVAFSAVFTIVNPLGAIGPFLSMTAGDPPDKKKSTAMRACTLATGVLLVCTGVGGFMFQFFGFTLPALKIAGGILLFNVGIDMLNARESRSRATEEEREEGTHKEDIAIFPLAIPLLSGPGAMVTVFILGERAKTTQEHAFVYLSVVATMVLSYLTLIQAHRLARVLGATGMNVMARMMGLILAAIAVQFVLDGLTNALPGLLGLHPS